jgi:hypothetical protein
MSKYEISALEIEGAIGRQFQTLSIVFACAVNTKLASLFGYIWSSLGTHKKVETRFVIKYA